MKNRLFYFSGIIGAFIFIITTLIGGYVFEGYSHISQYISESYASGTAYGPLLRWVGYIPAGLLMGLFCFALAKNFKASKPLVFGLIGFGIFYGAFTSLVSVFPCDFGCNRDYTEATLSQSLHTILSLFTYLLTPFCLLLSGIGFKRMGIYNTFAEVSIGLSLLGLVFGLIFLFNANSPIAGLLQRSTEAVYLFWIVYLSCVVLKVKDIDS